MLVPCKLRSHKLYVWKSWSISIYIKGYFLKKGKLQIVSSWMNSVAKQNICLLFNNLYFSINDEQNINIIYWIIMI